MVPTPRRAVIARAIDLSAEAVTRVAIPATAAIGVTLDDLVPVGKDPVQNVIRVAILPVPGNRGVRHAPRGNSIRILAPPRPRRVGNAPLDESKKITVKIIAMNATPGVTNPTREKRPAVCVIRGQDRHLELPDAPSATMASPPNRGHQIVGPHATPANIPMS